MCTSLEQVELPPFDGEPLDAASPLGEGPAAAAAFSPEQSIASFPRAADTVACAFASVVLSADSATFADSSMRSLFATACSACCMADGGVPVGTRMFAAPA